MTDPMVSKSEEPRDSSFQYVHTEGFPQILRGLGVSLFVSTYQAGKLIVAREKEGRISTLLRTFDKAMGLTVDVRSLTIGTRSQIWFLRNAPDIAPQLEPVGTHDACFVPRHSHVTGDIQVHEMAWVGKDLWCVNTRFSCLCTVDAEFSFVPCWRPPFVSQIAAEDRCHLNGLAVVDGEVKYVTALGETDTEGGWRDNKANGGILIDVPSGEIVARGLSMPHSPRIYDGRIWLLDSGTGRLVTVDRSDGRVDAVAEVPGYARGLAFAGSYAFLGLSKIRETAMFGDLPITGKLDEAERKCGVWVVDVRSGHTVAFMEFQSDLEETFDVQILAGLRYPAVIGLEKETVQGTFVVPRGAVDCGKK